jgi:hypothetical protein
MATDLLGPLGEPPNALPARDGAFDDTQGDRPPLNLQRLRPDAVAANRALRKVAILEHCRPYDSFDRDQPGPSLDSPAPLGTEPEAGDEDDAEMGATSRTPGATDGEYGETESLRPTTTKTSEWASPHQTGNSQRAPQAGRASVRRTTLRIANTQQNCKSSCGVRDLREE